MFVSLCTPTLTDLMLLRLQNNTASDFGGGIAFVQSPGVALTIDSSTISNNKVTAPMWS
jgi:hypothetical protein